MTSTVDRLVAELVEFLTPVHVALGSPAGFQRFIRRLGHEPAGASVEAALSSMAATAERLSDLVELLAEKAWADEPLDDGDLVRIVADVPAVIQAVRELPAVLNDVDLGPRFFSEVLDLLVVDYLEFRAPAVLRALLLLGVVESALVAPGDEDGRAVEFERYRIRWERLERFLASPFEVMEEVYGLGGRDFDANRLLSNAVRLIDELGLVAVPAELTGPLAQMVDDHAGDGAVLVGVDVPLHQIPLNDVEFEAGLVALPLKGIAAPVEDDRGIGIMPYAEGTVAEETPITDDGRWTLHVDAGAELAGGMVFGLRPSGLSVHAGVLDSSVPAGSFRMEVERVKAAGEEVILLLGDPEGTRLEAAGLTFGVGGEDGDFYGAAGVHGLRLVVDVSGDALLSQIVPAPIVAEAGDIVGGWRLGRGIYLEQGSGMNVRIPLDVGVAGVLRLRQLGLALELEPEVALTATVSGDVSIGPLFLSMNDLGYRTAVTSNPDGAFGTFDIDTSVQFPTGYGARLEAGPISGGGELHRRDHEYRGALALRFEPFGLSAFAVLTTRMPSGEPGFSFLASIFGDVEVQLGYGFRLTGVGGIIGIDRGVDVEALRTVLSVGRLDSVLFPRAPIQDASVILEDLAAIFPQRKGRYVIGPMARVAWGTPTLIEGKLGVVFELGAGTRAAILGSVVTALPDKSAAIVVLNVDFIGTVEFATGAIGFDAVVTNSRILSWPVSGEAAFRTGWGSSAGLVASVGGFHPEFSPPPGFPSLQPITIDFATNNPSLTLTAYLAVTLNSVQAGANASLYAKGPKIIFVGRFAVEGSVGFDALISFDPFAFDAKLWLGLNLLLDGDVVCGIGGDLRLRGPNRYEINGTLRVSVLGVSVKVKVNKAWGTAVTERAQVVDGVAMLRAAVEAAEGFEPIAVPTRVSGVGFTRESREEAHALVDPSGGVRFLQRVVPLAVAIDRIGTSRLVGDRRTFDLAFIDDGSTFTGKAAMWEFVRGAFFELSESQRLRGPATEPHRAGIELRGPDDIVIDEAKARSFDFEYEVVFLGDDEEDTRPAGDHAFDPPVAERLTRLVAERTSAPLNGSYVPDVLRSRRIGVLPVTYVAVGDVAVEKGPKPKVAPDGSIVTAPLSALTKQLARDERAIARHLTAAGG